MYINSFVIIGFHQLAQYITLIWGICYGIFSILTRPQTEAFMMFRCNLDILSTHFFGHLCPFLRIKFRRVPLIHQFQPFISRYFCPAFQPFGSSAIYFSIPLSPGDSIQSPVDEGTQTIVTELLHGRVLPFTFIRSSIFQRNFLLCFLSKRYRTDSNQ